jgi:Dyp-type peroxidase family
MTELDLQDIQGNILRGYKFPHVAHVFGRIDEGNLPAWRSFLRAIKPELTRADDWGAEKPATTLNVGFSYAAIAKLQPGIARELSGPFSAFAEGMPKRSADLGDDESFARQRWEDRHVWLVVHARQASLLAPRVSELKRQAVGLDLIDERPGAALVDKDYHWREHFGFRDDISYPVVEGSPVRDDELPGRGKLEDGAWVPIRTGEFLLGYRDESDANPWADAKASTQALLRNGTFGVVRELRQDVPTFRRYLREQAGPQASMEYLAACMLGRKLDGEPLALGDRRPSSEVELSSFTYEGDPQGARCPLGAHVRRANPRTNGRHRLIRRGMSYGPAFVDGELGEVERGLWFVAFNASIEDQFEFIQRVWLNTPVGTLSDARDPIAGRGAERAMVIEGDRSVPRAPRLLLDIPDFVTCLGGQYYFYPGLTGFDVICGEPERVVGNWRGKP